MKGRLAIFLILPLAAFLFYSGGANAAEDGNLGVGGVDLLIAPVPSFEPVRLVYSGNLGVKCIALTFDDAPNPFYTDELLKILREKGVRATFFCMGNKCQLYPDLLVKILRDGHDVGNHSYSHPKLDTLSREDWQEEILYTNRIIKRVLGYDCRLFRPPHGRYNDEIIDFAYAHGLTTCLWTLTTGDYLEPAPNALTKKVMAGSGPGGIILMHDGTDCVLQALPDMIDKLKAQGYLFVTMSELIRGKVVF